jgi:predicted dienelactone hydrolase
MGSLGLCGLAAATAMATVLPVFELPAPTGPFPIGSVNRHFVDESRRETRGDRAGGPRELMVQIWYPSERSGPGQPYRSRREVAFKKEHLALVRTHASPGVPLASAQKRYPLLIFSPSWGGCRNQNTFQVEELASQGFIVIGIDHPYGSSSMVFPDGRVAYSTLGEWMDYSSDEKLAESIRADSAELEVRTADVRFVLDEIERLNRHDSGGLLTGRVDTASVGIFGHSFGGAVSAEACRLDPRIKAGIDLDGVLFGESAANGVDQPFLFMKCGLRVPGEEELENARGSRRRHLAIAVPNERNIRRSLTAHGGYLMSIRGVEHMNFCDSPLYSSVKWLTKAGPIDARRGMRIMNDYTLAFFNQHIRSMPQKLMDGTFSQYPEVEFEVWPSPVRQVASSGASEDR